MNLVNYEYIKLDTFSIFTEIIKSLDEEDDARLNFFQKLNGIIMDYEREYRIHISDFYIRISDLENQQCLNIDKIPVERQIVLNSILYAVYNNDLEMLDKLTSIDIQNYEILQSELGGNLNYILNHSMDINEYINGEEERLVYVEKESKLEKTYIFNYRKKEKSKKLN